MAKPYASKVHLCWLRDDSSRHATRSQPKHLILSLSKRTIDSRGISRRLVFITLHETRKDYLLIHTYIHMERDTI